ncbi:DnaJ domain family protein [Leishmania donovani]|uniref:DnaJ domain family protein n=1 Tax=Leishmania donovani TaxID=5661 RepID=A0A504XCK7_LEIDO|nr:DnaJ domain family protein [Leishmania donovani]
MTSVRVRGSTMAMRTRGANWGVAATMCSYRCVSSGTSQHQQQHVAADELRAALRTLGLAEESTDAEVKRAFQAFAIQHHPDTNAVWAAALSSSDEASSNTRSQAHAAERMRLGTEAYQLLRRIPYGVRQHILRGEGQGGGVGVRGRFRGPHDANFTFTAEEYAKVQRIYQGDRHRRRRHRGGRDKSGGAGDGNGDEDLFDARTEEGRRRIARLNEFQARVVEMRRRGIRDDLPPWRVYENDKGAGTVGDSRSASTSGGDAEDGHQERHGSRAAGTGPRNTNRLGLHFFNVTTSSLREVRDLYRSRPGFAGMDGSSYDNPHSAARVAPEISSNPHLRQYILMKSRAQEKAIVDRAVGRPLLLFLLLVTLSAAMVMMAATVRSYRMRMQKDEDLRRRDEERGGA